MSLLFPHPLEIAPPSLQAAGSGGAGLGEPAPAIIEDLREHRATVLLVDAQSGAIVDANQAALHFYGWSRDELLARTIFEVNTAPGAQVREALDRLSRAGKVGKERADEREVMLFEHRMADGSLRDVEVSSSPLWHGGRLLLCSIVHDVTRRRHEQERSAQVSRGLQGVLAGADELLGLSLDDLLRRAVELGRERLGLERCAIYLVDREAGLMRGTYAIDREGRALDHRAEEHADIERWLADSTPADPVASDSTNPSPGARWVIMQGALNEWRGERLVTLRESGWTAITLIRSSRGIIGTFHNDCAWSGAPVSTACQELVDVYCSLLGSMIERKRVEDALRESETRLRLLAENATDLVGRVDMNGRILYLSPSCQDVLGFEPADLLGRSIFDLCHPEDASAAEYVRLHGRENYVEGETARRELRALSASSEWVWLEVVSKQLWDADGTLREVQFSARDISARRHAEEAQRQSEERFRLFMDNTPAMTFIKDAEGRYLYLNQAAQNIYNAPINETLGGTNFDRLPPSVASRLRANDEQVLATGQPHEFLEVVPDSSGRERSWLTFKFPLREAGGALSIGGVAIDVTERREFEAALSRSKHRLSTVLDSAPLVLWTLDRDGVFTTSEGQGLQAMGLAPRQVVGRSAFELYAENPNLSGSIRRVLDGEEFSGDVSLGQSTLQCRHKPIFNARGEVTGSLGVAVDITERRRAEEALARTVERLENLLEIDRAIRSAHSPSEIAQAALSRLCAQLNCCHAAVTVFNFEAGEATVLAARGGLGDASSGNESQPESAEPAPRASNALMKGERYPLDEIVAMLPPLVVRDINAPPLSERLLMSERLLFTEPTPDGGPNGALSVERNGADSASGEDSALAVLKSLGFWQRQWSGEAGGDLQNEKRRSLPLIAGGELVGALDVESVDGPIPEERWMIAREVAGQLAIAIHQARLFEAVGAGRRQLQALSHRLIEAQEAERRHLARELHDEIGQVLTAVKLNMQGVSKLTEKWIERWAATHPQPIAPEVELAAAREAQGMRVRLSESVEIVEHALSQVRDLSLNLRPSLLDDLGLAPALRWFVDRLATRGGIPVQLDILLSPSRLRPEIETACFRVAQEALTNATRHSRAHRIEIVLGQSEDWLEMLIRDDGQGFDVRQAREKAAGGSSLGLLGMEERALLVGGRLSIESTPGRGTTLHAFFPLQEAWPAPTTDEPEEA